MGYSARKKREFRTQVDIYAPKQDGNGSEKVGDLNVTYRILDESKLDENDDLSLFDHILVKIEGLVDAEDNELTGADALEVAKSDPLLIAAISSKYREAIIKKNVAKR